MHNQYIEIKIKPWPMQNEIYFRVTSVQPSESGAGKNRTTIFDKMFVFVENI